MESSLIFQQYPSRLVGKGHYDARSPLAPMPSVPSAASKIRRSRQLDRCHPFGRPEHRFACIALELKKTAIRRRSAFPIKPPDGSTNWPERGVFPCVASYHAAGVASMIIRGGGIGGIGNAIGQGISLGLDPCRSFPREFNVGSFVGSIVGGAISAGLSVGATGVSGQIATAGRSAAIEATAGGIGQSVGQR